MIVVPPLRGHLDPAGALALALARLGHRVTIVSDAGVERVVPDGIGYRAVELPNGAAHLQADMKQAASMHGFFGMITGLAWRADALCVRLPEVFEALGATMVIADQTEPAAALACRVLGLPLVSLAAALPLNREDSIPPPHLGWRYAPDGHRDWINRGGYRVADLLMRPVSRVLARHAKAYGLAPIERLEDLFSDTLQLAQMLPDLDYPRLALSPAMHRLGPFRIDDDGVFALPPDPLGRPLAFCSLGTLQGARFAIFEAVARVAQRLGVRLVIAHGGMLSAAQVARLPGDPIVRDFVPQRAVLRQARIAIVHGGHNTVLDAVSLGVPVVTIPIAFDQAAMGARVAWQGSGVVVARRAGRAGLEPAMRTVLADPRYAAAAGRLAVQARQAGGANRAAALVDDLLRRQAGPARLG